MMRLSATTTFTVAFGPLPKRPAVRAQKGRIPRIARMLALAHKIEEMIRAGNLRDLADAARAIGVTRARVTQIMNLLLLAPEIQEAILDLPAVTQRREFVSERSLRTIVAEPYWDVQRRLWDEAKP